MFTRRRERCVNSSRTKTGEQSCYENGCFIYIPIVSNHRSQSCSSTRASLTAVFKQLMLKQILCYYSLSVSSIYIRKSCLCNRIMTSHTRCRSWRTVEVKSVFMRGAGARRYNHGSASIERGNTTISQYTATCFARNLWSFWCSASPTASVTLAPNDLDTGECEAVRSVPAARASTWF